VDEVIGRYSASGKPNREGLRLWVEPVLAKKGGNAKVHSDGLHIAPYMVRGHRRNCNNCTDGAHRRSTITPPAPCNLHQTHLLPACLRAPLPTVTALPQHGRQQRTHSRWLSE
jgi:hypothetical protein